MNKCKVMISIGLFFLSSLQATQSELRSLVASRRPQVINRSSLFVPSRLGELSVMHNKSGFSIQKDNLIKPIHNESLDKLLRGISRKNLAKVLSCGYLSVNKSSDGQYSIKHSVRGLGGGVGGAWWGSAVGNFVGHAIVQTGIVVASGAVGAAAGAVATVTLGPVAGIAAAGGAAKVTFASLEATVVPLATPFIHAVALAGGIAGAVATGPV